MSASQTPALTVSLRLPDRVGASWSLSVDPLRGRPDLRPERPWPEIRPGHRVLFGDGEAYEVEGVVPEEDGPPESEAHDADPAVAFDRPR